MSSANIIEVTDANFSDEVLKSSTPVLVDFWAEWCGPCKQIAPLLDELATEYAGKVKIGKVDIETNNNLAVRHGVTAIPTLLIFKNGQVIDQIVGMKGKKDLKSALDRAST